MDQQYKVFTHRTVLTLSNQLTPEEYRKILAVASNRTIEEMPAIDSDAWLVAARERTDKVKKITEDFKALLDSKPNTNDKYEELGDIGRFIVAANEEPPADKEFVLDVPEEIARFPDFILSYTNKKLGVEHTRLLSEATIQIYKAAKRVIKIAEAILAKDLSHLSKTVNIFIDYNENVIGSASFKKKNLTAQQKNEAANLIAEFIRSELTGGNAPKPSFIFKFQISHNKDSRVDIELGEMYFTDTEFSKQLLNRIADKEDRAMDYRKEVTVDKLWLLIVIDDIAGFSGFFIASAHIPEINTSNFDNIFLFEKYIGKIHPIYP